jgi:hypothetical protein
LAYYTGLHIDLFQRIVVSPASVSVLALGRDGPVQVMRINDAGPIQLPKRPEAASHEEKEHPKSDGAVEGWIEPEKTSMAAMPNTADLRDRQITEEE